MIDRRLFRSASFRFGLIYAVLLMASAAALALFLWWATAGLLDRQTEAAIRAEGPEIQQIIVRVLPKAGGCLPTHRCHSSRSDEVAQSWNPGAQSKDLATHAPGLQRFTPAPGMTSDR